MSFEELDTKVKESAPLIERLDECMSRIGKMCKEGRPPKMTIPCQWYDDDIFITTTIREAVEQLRALDLPIVCDNCLTRRKSGDKCESCGSYNTANQ